MQVRSAVAFLALACISHPVWVSSASSASSARRGTGGWQRGVQHQEPVQKYHSAAPHTHSSSSSTPADALTARKGTILQQPIYGGSQRPALPIFLFRGSFFLHIRTPILQQLELTFARMGLQNDLRDTRGANLF